MTAKLKPCKFCTDPDGDPCYPAYGTAPHSHKRKNGIVISTKILPREKWPENFQEDPVNSGSGVWWCPKCGCGKPETSPGSSPASP